MNPIRAARDFSAAFQIHPRRRARPRLSTTSCLLLNKITLRGWALFISLLLLPLSVPSAQAGQDGPLNFFKNYFVTGDYAVGGVGLRGLGSNGFATATIHMADPRSGQSSGT